MDLKELRVEIDRVDAELIRLLEERMDIVVQIAEYKREHKLPIYDPKREREKLKELREKTRGETYSYIASCIQAVMDASKAYEAEKNR